MSGSETLFVVSGEESFVLSAARDTFTFGALLGTSIALNTLMEPSGWLNATLGISWFIWVLGRSARHRMTKTPDEARAWLDERYPPTGEQP